jgi:hypothetical protein
MKTGRTDGAIRAMHVWTVQSPYHRLSYFSCAALSLLSFLAFGMTVFTPLKSLGKELLHVAQDSLVTALQGLGNPHVSWAPCALHHGW